MDWELIHEPWMSSGYDPGALQILYFFLSLVVLSALILRRHNLYQILTRRFTFSPWLSRHLYLLPLTASLLTFAYVFGNMGLRHVVFALSIGIGVGFGLFDSTLAVSLFISLLLLRPWELDPSNAFMLKMPRLIGVATLLSFLLDKLFKDRNLSIKIDTTLKLFLAFGFWAFLSTIKRPDPLDAANLFYELYFKIIIVFFLGSQIFRTIESLKVLYTTLFFSVLGLSFIAIFLFILHPETGRLKSFGYSGDPNDLSALVVMAFPLLFLRLIKRRNVLAIGAALLTLVLALVVVKLSGSRGAILAAGASFAGYLFFCANLSKTKKIMMLLALAAPVVYFSTHMQRSESDLDESAKSRVVFWDAAVRMAVKNPALGVGWDGFPTSYPKYATTLEFKGGFKTAHSSWFLALGETGFVGGFLFLAFWLSLFPKAFRKRFQHPEIISAYIGYTMAMSFLSHTYSIYPYIMGLICLSTEENNSGVSGLQPAANEQLSAKN